MVTTPIYMDNHATTRVDPRVVQAMLPYFERDYGNAGSVSHEFGNTAKEAVEQARQTIAHCLNASPREIVFTSGATESNNLALRGVAERSARRGRHIISVQTEHKAILDPLKRLSRHGYDVTLLQVEQAGSPLAGWLDPARVEQALRDDTILVSVMLANNEVGVLQPLADIAEICQRRDVVLHTDATQAVGRLPIDVAALNVGLLSFSAHKVYGPKGVGALYVRRRQPQVRLAAQIEGGGQEHGLRSGTLNVPGIVGFATAVQLAVAEMDTEQPRLRQLRDQLYEGLSQRIRDVTLNGPALDQPEARLAGNLNCSFAFVDGEALMMNMRDVAVSSGSACTSANPEPSHVLRALGISEDLTRASLRFGLGRFNTADEVSYAIQCVEAAVQRLRRLSSLAQ